MEVNYNERMINYYPQVIQAIKEFRAIVEGESTEVDSLSEGVQRVIDDAYLFSMSEKRITQWEKMLGIQPLENSTINDRRDTIIARIRGQGKLNTELINTIVRTFTGGTANSWVKDSTLYVEITPPRNNKSYRFENVEQELRKKVPAHLGFKVERNYYTWEEIEIAYPYWQDVYDNFGSWEDVLLFVPFETEVYNR